MSRVKAVLLGGLILFALALGLTLSQSPITVAAANAHSSRLIFTTRKSLYACQSNEVLPRGTSAIRMQVFASTGPRVMVEVLEHGRVITRGEQGTAWTGGSVTVPVDAMPAPRASVKLCFSFFLNGQEAISLKGERTRGALAARTHDGPLPGRVTVEYLRPGRSSWLSLAPEVARRMGLGHAASGTWGVLLVVLLMAGVALLSTRVILRELR